MENRGRRQYSLEVLSPEQQTLHSRSHHGSQRPRLPKHGRPTKAGWLRSITRSKAIRPEDALLLIALTIQITLILNDGFQPIGDTLEIVSISLVIFAVYALYHARRQDERERISSLADSLRRPLTVLRGYLSLIQDGDVGIDPVLATLDNKVSELQDIVSEMVERK